MPDKLSNEKCAVPPLEVHHTTIKEENKKGKEAGLVMYIGRGPSIIVWVNAQKECCLRMLVEAKGQSVCFGSEAHMTLGIMAS